MKKLALPLIGLAAVIGFSFLGGCNKVPVGTYHPEHSATVDSITCDSTGAYLNDSLWAYYPFSGNENDSTGHGHTLTLDTGVALGPDMNGVANHALSFAGILHGRAEIADGANFNPASFTVSMWIDYKVQGGFAFTKTNYATAEGTSFSIGQDPANWIDTLRFALGTTPNVCSTPNASGVECKNTAGTSLNTWYHLVGVFSNGTGKIYVNGQLKGTVTTPYNVFTWCSNAPFILGDWWSAAGISYAFNGEMDNIRIYTRALCDLEVAYLYRHQL